MATTASILINVLDDDTDYHLLIGDILRAAGIVDVVFHKDWDTFIESLSADLNITILDHRLEGGKSGLDMIKIIKLRNKYSYVIVMSGTRNFDIAIEYLNNGADKYLDKGWSDYEKKLVEYVKEAIEEAQERTEIVRYLERKMKTLSA